MCQIRQLFSSCKNSIFGVEDRQRAKGVTLFTYRPNNKAPAIRCRIYQSDGQSRVEYLNSKYASYACQSDSDSIYPLFAWEFGLTAISEPAPGGWSEPGPKLEARRLINFVRSYAKFSAEPFMQVSGLNSHL